MTVLGPARAPIAERSTDAPQPDDEGAQEFGGCPRRRSVRRSGGAGTSEVYSGADLLLYPVRSIPDHAWQRSWREASWGFAPWSRTKSRSGPATLSHSRRRSDRNRPGFRPPVNARADRPASRQQACWRTKISRGSGYRRRLLITERRFDRCSFMAASPPAEAAGRVGGEHARRVEFGAELAGPGQPRSGPPPVRLV